MKVIQAVTAAYLCIMLHVAASHAAAVSMATTIHNPCQTNPNVDPTLPSTIDLLKSAVTAANAAGAPIRTLMDKIKTDGLLTDSEYNKSVQGNVTLPGLHETQKVTNVNISDMVAILKQHYNDTSIHILFLQTAIEDQVEYDNGKYKPELQNVQSYLYACLCKANMLIKSLKDDVTQYLDSSVVPYYLKNMSDDKKRYKRNLILINKGKLLLTVKIANYAKMIDAMSSVG